MAEVLSGCVWGYANHKPTAAVPITAAFAAARGVEMKGNEQPNRQQHIYTPYIKTKIKQLQSN